MREFERIYFDTSTLIAEGWPCPSGKLQECLEWANRFNMRVFLPWLVEQELGAKWLREFKDKCQKVDSRIKELNKHLLSNTIAVEIPSRDEALKGYHKRVSGFDF